MNQIQQRSTVEIMPPVQPRDEVRHITYHVNIDGAGGWLMALAQMPTAAWYGLSVAVGVIGAATICVLMVISAIMSQFLIAAVVVVGIIALSLVALVAMMG
ncbi:MAG TPA: hypothetical protein VLA24_09300 [Pseudomonadales bacterium]|nr:hypothetical protein [Pseudomonadales bacterium]